VIPGSFVRVQDPPDEASVSATGVTGKTRTRAGDAPSRATRLQMLSGGDPERVAIRPGYRLRRSAHARDGYKASPGGPDYQSE